MCIVQPPQVFIDGVRWRVFVLIQGHEAKPVVGKDDQIQEVAKGEDELKEDDSQCRVICNAHV